MNLTSRIILADGHVRFRQELKKIINKIEDVAIIAEVGDGNGLIDLLKHLRPDLILLDISLPNFRGMKATAAVKAMYPEIKVITMVMDGANEYLSHARAAGADGILLKQDSPGDLALAIREVCGGEGYFPEFLDERKKSITMLQR